MSDDDFSKQNYRDWPLFKQLRKHEEFRSIYEECYNESFPIQETTTKNSDVEQENPEYSGSVRDEMAFTDEPKSVNSQSRG